MKTCLPSVWSAKLRGVTIDRAFPRYAHEAAVVLRVGEQTIEGRTTNVSRGGLCADLVELVPVGTELEVDMKLVFEDSISDALRLPARVVWATAVDDAFQIGLAWRPLRAELAQHLTTFLRYLHEGSQPERARRESSLDKRFG